MNCLAISNFPSHFNQSKLAPALQERGFDRVIFETTGQTRQISLENIASYDTILYFCDLTSHSDYWDIKSMVKKAGKSLQLLNRKTASWPDTLNVEPIDKENHMPPAKSVSDADMPLLLKDFMNLSEKGASHQALVKAASKYFKVRPLTSYKQLYTYIHRILSKEECPEFFYKWYFKIDELEEKPKECVAEPITIVEQEVVEPPKELIYQAPDKQEATRDDLLQWNRMLEEENAQLVTQLKLLRMDIAEARKEGDTSKALLSKAQNDLREAQSVVRMKDTDGIWKIKETVIAAKRMVELGAMEPNEAFERVVKVLLSTKPEA